MRWARFLMISALPVLILSGFGCSKQVNQPVVETDVPTRSHTLQHTVVQGETLNQIAENYYGDRALANRIARDNGISDPDRIVPGSVLILEFDEGQWQGAHRRSAALEAYNRGVDLMAQERLAEAEKQFRLALDTEPDLLSARYNLALVLSQRGKNNEASDILKSLTLEHPGDVDFLFAHGHSLFMLTRFDEAILQFEKALTVEESHKRAAFGLARSLQEDGQVLKAIDAWKIYLELDDNSSWADVARRNLRKLRDGS